MPTEKAGSTPQESSTMTAATPKALHRSGWPDRQRWTQLPYSPQLKPSELLPHNNPKQSLTPCAKRYISADSTSRPTQLADNPTSAPHHLARRKTPPKPRHTTPRLSSPPRSCKKCCAGGESRGGRRLQRPANATRGQFPDDADTKSPGQPCHSLLDARIQP